MNVHVCQWKPGNMKLNQKISSIYDNKKAISVCSVVGKHQSFSNVEETHSPGKQCNILLISNQNNSKAINRL